MRVLLVLANGGHGGMQHRTQDLAVELERLGIAVEVAVGGGDGGAITKVPVVELAPFERRLAGGPAFLATLRKEVGRFDADVVHGRGLRLAPALRVAAWPRAVAVTAAGMPEDDVARAASILRRSGVPVSAIGPGPVRQLAEHGIEARLLPNVLSDPPPPMDRAAAVATFGLDPDRPLAVAACRLVPQKDPLTLIDALAAAPRWQLLLLGEGPLDEAIDQRAAALGVGDRLVRSGWRDDARAILGGADALLCSSAWEGQGGVLVEAMAAGVPVVATSCPGVAEWVRDGAHALLAAVGDGAALGAALDATIDELPAATRRVETARDLVAPNVGLRAGRSYLAYYRELLGGVDQVPELPGSAAAKTLERFRRFPRWQTGVSRALARTCARSGRLSAAQLRRIEFDSARLLGQPLSPRRWEEMTFNDKVVYHRLRDEDPELISFNDKLAMREVVRAKLGDAALPAVLGIGETAAAFAELDGPFVLKGNHGSGYVIVVHEPRRLTAEERARADGWTQQNFGSIAREYGYEAARPLLFAEELLAYPSPTDYKVFCFDGVPTVVLVCFDRASGLKRVFVDLEWRVVGGMQVVPSFEPPPRPPNFDTMIAWAEVLSAGQGFLRVDLYDLGDRVLVGELTPYPLGARQRFAPASLDRELGRAWQRRP